MVVFNEKDHTYQNPVTKRFYISVSTLLSKYKEPFDRDYFAGVTAMKKGKTKEEVLKDWDKTVKDACDKGTNIHKILENYLVEGTIENATLLEKFDKIFNKKDFQLVRNEYIIFNDEYEIAGTSDLICDVNNELFDVYDFKTNKKFLFHSEYGKYLKTPLNNLQQCHYNDYSLQLSLYAYLYSIYANKKVRKICIFYYDGNEFKSYPVPYLYWEISVLIKHYIQNHGQTAVDQNKNVIAKLQS
jgi:ATP-dependent exoDNAse (exonuclease V) beta subunit